MRYRSSLIALVSLLALALATPAVQAASPRAVVYSKSETVGGEVKGGLFAVKSGHLNQITENPADTEPAFSGDGRTIAFVRAGDLYSIRPDGSGQRQLTSGAELDGRPIVSPNSRYVVFERRATEGAPRDLYTVGIAGGGVHALVSSSADEREATFSPDGCMIAFVRSSAGNDDLFSVKPAGVGLRRLTHTAGLDEFAPGYFADDEGIVFSRGESSEGPAAYADVYTMRSNGRTVRPLIRGVGSAYVEDVSPDGHTLLLRRDQGLWSKRIGPGRAHKLAQLPDGSHTNGVFSSDGRKVAAFVGTEDQQALVAIDVASRRQTQLAEGFEASEKDGTVIGPVIAWQPAR
jgi:Tol biopolymer transport system component